jgi:hypothetical protein
VIEAVFLLKVVNHAIRVHKHIIETIRVRWQRNIHIPIADPFLEVDDLVTLPVGARDCQIEPVDVRAVNVNSPAAISGVGA